MSTSAVVFTVMLLNKNRHKTFRNNFHGLYRVSQKKRYQLPLKSAIFGSHGWKFGVTLIRVCRIRILNQIGPITFRNTPKSRSKNRKITKNRFVRFLSISSSNRLGIGDIFTPTPDLRSKNYSPIFSEFKTVFRLKIGWNFARFCSIFENVFPIEFFFFRKISK